MMECHGSRHRYCKRAGFRVPSKTLLPSFLVASIAKILVRTQDSQLKHQPLVYTLFDTVYIADVRCPWKTNTATDGSFHPAYFMLANLITGVVPTAKHARIIYFQDGKHSLSTKYVGAGVKFDKQITERSASLRTASETNKRASSRHACQSHFTCC